jgi:hypothetical protein
MNVLFVKTSSSMGAEKLSETLLITSDDLIIQEHLQWFHTISLQYESQLLTPDDLIIQDHIARKHRWSMSIKQLQRRQLQVLNQIMK